MKYMQLQDVLYGVTIKELVGRTDRDINVLNFDSRKITDNDVFFAIAGTVSDGHLFIEQTLNQDRKSVV